MPPMIFLNLAVSDVAASRDFYAALGYRIDQSFSDDDCACVRVSGQICVMLLDRIRFADFVTGPVGDPAASTSATYCLSADSREQVDDLVATALAHGGKPWKDPVSSGPLYGRSFADPEGHVWEALFIDRPQIRPTPS